MNRFMTPVNVCLTILFVFITLATLSPNPFGNSPDIIADESYFLTSSLSALKKITPPGLDFTPAGNYYGGVQTYIDTAVITPAIGALLVLNHFSLTETQIYIALHTGDLLAILRFANSLCVVLFCGFFFMLFAKRKIPKQLALQFLFLLFLLFGTSLVAGFVHTAKVWTLYLLIDVGISVLFIANEYYLRHRQEPFISKKTYVACIVWALILAFFQNYVGIFPVMLWASYALILKHITINDIWKYARQYWYYIAGFSFLQISFLYRAIFVKNHTGWWDPGQVSVTVDDSIDWVHRLHNPLLFAVQSQPLVLLYALGLIVVFLLLITRSLPTDSKKRTLIAIACIHPILIYIVFHVLLGFSLFPRYALTFTVACVLAIVILAGENKLLLRVGFILSGILFIFVGSHAMTLYWQPSSEVVLTRMIEEKLNSAETVLVVQPDAWRLNLPLNADSLKLLNPRRQNMSRYQFLLQHLDKVNSFVPFASTVVLPDTTSEAAISLLQFKDQNKSVWNITTECNALCSVTETEAKTCFMVNTQACGYTPQEINTLTDFSSFTQLGNSYIVRKVY